MASGLVPPRRRLVWCWMPVLLLWVAAFPGLGAQSRSTQSRTVPAADSAFRIGDVARAESLYYVGVRERPRDPVAREALGRYLAARGASKVAVVLLEEARMFGGDPARIAMHLAPLYQFIGDWRAVLTLPSSPLGATERRRAAWLVEHPFGSRSDSMSAALIGTPKGDTLARVAVRIGNRAAVAISLGTDIGFVVGARVAGSGARHFPGPDSAIVAIDSLSVGSLKLVNVPATLGTAPGAVTIGIAAFNRLIPTLDYARNRVTFTRMGAGAAESRYLLVRDAGHWRVLERGRWISLGDFAASVAKARKSMSIDVRAGEVRVRP